MHKLRTITAIVGLSVVTLMPSLSAQPSPTTYRNIELPDPVTRETHGDDIIRQWIDAYYEGRPLHHWAEAHPDTLDTYGHEAVHAWIVLYWRQVWIDTYNANLAAEQAQKEAQRRSGGSYVNGIEVCNGGDLPPCHVVHRESRFDPNARNPRSTAWGLYQFLRGTWRGVCPEYPHGSATVAQQVECARRLWDNGRGRSHWALTL